MHRIRPLHWLKKFRALPGEERRLLLRTMVLVGFIRLGLWLLPIRTMRQALARLSQPDKTPLHAADITAERIGWIVRAASQAVPKASCLTQALAAQTLLARRGYPVRLHIGVAKGPGGQLQAHAWLDSNNTIIVGGTEPEVGRFKPLLAWDKQDS